MMQQPNLAYATTEPLKYQDVWLLQRLIRVSSNKNLRETDIDS